MILEETEHGVLITPMNEEYFRSFAGILKKTGALDEELRKMKEEEEKHEERKANLHLKTTKKHK